MRTFVLASFGRGNKIARLIGALTVMAVSGAAQTSPALTTLYSFTGGNNGANPGAGVVFGKGGSLFGTTYYGGAKSLGTVYELTPGTGSTWTQSVIYSFQGGTDGANPDAALTPGAGGVLYGTTFLGGSTGNGTVFQSNPPASSGAPWTETVLYSFQGGTDGSGPRGSVIRMSNGTLYGTTFGGGNMA